jgi:transcription elongation GreA/GreB family factor
MDKQALFQELLDHLSARIERLQRNAKEAHTEATHEQNKAENKYDTRGLEASYLAEGQTLQAVELEQNFAQLQALPLRSFDPAEGADIGALVQLTDASEKTWHLIAPCAGGTELKTHPVLVLTPESPLGKRLLGKRPGDKVSLTIGRTTTHFTISSVL